MFEVPAVRGTRKYPTSSILFRDRAALVLCVAVVYLVPRYLASAAATLARSLPGPAIFAPGSPALEMGRSVRCFGVVLVNAMRPGALSPEAPAFFSTSASR